MGPESTGSRSAARGSGNRLRTALACVGAVACVAASASGSLPFDADAVQAPGSQTAGAAGATGSPSRDASPAAYIRPDRAPTASELPPTLAAQGAQSADVSPSWLAHVAPSGAAGGSRAARQLSAQVLEGTAPTGISSSALGIPGPVLAAYHDAADDLARTDPSCGVPWWLLAGIGRIESGHASGGRVDSNGTTLGRILGPRLDGSMAGNAVIHDSDGGVFDGDPHYDRAVGPMQFLPGTWKSVASDGNGDGVSDPNNVYDATLGAARYLCLGGADLRTPAGLSAAVLRYNNSMDYVRSVLTWGQAYRDGDTAPVKSAPGRVPAAVNPRQAPVAPPASPTKDDRTRDTQRRTDKPSSDTKDTPVVADGPRKSSSSTPRPSSTVPPTTKPSGTKSGGSKGSSSSPKGTSGSSKGTSDQRGGDSTNPPSSKSTSSPSSTTSPGKTPTASDKTNPTDSGKTPPSDSPTTARAKSGEAWLYTQSIKANEVRALPLETPVGGYNVTLSTVKEGTTVRHGRKDVLPADGEQFLMVQVAAPNGTRTPATKQQIVVGNGTFTLTPGQATSVIVSVKGTALTAGKLEVDTAYSQQTLDLATGVEDPIVWTEALTAPTALKDAHPAAVPDSDYADKASISSMSAAPYVTPWDPTRGEAAEGQVWLVVPYSLDAQIAPEGYEGSTWLTPTVSVGTETIDPAVLQPLAPGQQSLVFPVSEKASGEVSIAPRAQVKAQSDDPDGTIATFAPLTFSI